jgi:hypothetical protein
VDYSVDLLNNFLVLTFLTVWGALIANGELSFGEFIYLEPSWDATLVSLV